MRAIHAWTAAFAAALLLAGVPAAAQTEIAMPEGDWSAGETGAVFPARIGDYKRTQIVEYAAENWGVSYQPSASADGKFRQAVSIYLYTRGPATCAQEFEGTKAAIEQAREETKLFERPARSPLGGSEDALIARYTFKIGPASWVLSDAYLYCRPASKWWIKSRSTWVASEKLETGAELVLAGIGWPKDLAD
jgi:hypothetical protein